MKKIKRANKGMSVNIEGVPQYKIGRIRYYDKKYYVNAYPYDGHGAVMISSYGKGSFVPKTKRRIVKKRLVKSILYLKEQHFLDETHGNKNPNIKAKRLKIIEKHLKILRKNKMRYKI